MTHLSSLLKSVSRTLLYISVLALFTSILYFGWEGYVERQHNPNEPILVFSTTSGFGYKSHSPIIRIEDDYGTCSAFVISDDLALTAGHCLVGDFKLIKTKSFKVFDQEGYDTEVTATAVSVDLFRDVGILHGNFSSFYFADVDFDGHTVLSSYKPLISCGFPGGQKKIFCATLQYQGHFNEQYTLGGEPIFRGMSGGSVAQGGVVIGINSAMMGPYVFISPTIGVLELLGIRNEQ